MKFEEQYSKLTTYYSTFTNRDHALMQMFLTLGNGMHWQDGTLVDTFVPYDPRHLPEEWSYEGVGDLKKYAFILGRMSVTTVPYLSISKAPVGLDPSWITAMELAVKSAEPYVKPEVFAALQIELARAKGE